jgi:hypothetical protein
MYIRLEDTKQLNNMCIVSPSLLWKVTKKAGSGDGGTGGNHEGPQSSQRLGLYPDLKMYVHQH